MFCGMSRYYLKKYSFTYPFYENDGTPYVMCTLPISSLIDMYLARLGQMPKSFFDCGAAIGYMVYAADKMGMRARGIDVRRYTFPQPMGEMFRPYFTSGQIKIQSILDTAPVTEDLAYCNGTLTYMNETTLPMALRKFQNVNLLIAIHNTDEDLIAAKEMGDPITHSEPRLIRSKSWWMDTFRKNGFNVDFDSRYGCFCARPIFGRSASMGYGGVWSSQFVAYAR